MKKKKIITNDQYLVRLKKAIKDLGGATEAGKAWGVHRGNVWNAAQDNIPPGPKILSAIGLKKLPTTMVHTFEEID